MKNINFKHTKSLTFLLLGMVLVFLIAQLKTDSCSNFKMETAPSFELTKNYKLFNHKVQKQELLSSNDENIIYIDQKLEPNQSEYGLYLYSDNTTTHLLDIPADTMIDTMLQINKNQYVYITLTGKTHKFYSLDISTNENHLLYQYDSIPPVIKAKMYDPNTIMFFYPQAISNGYKYNFSTLNLSTLKSKQFIKTQYDSNKNIGDISTSFCTDGKKTYIFSTKYNQDALPTYQIGLFEENGKLVQNFSIDLGEFLDLEYYFGHEIMDTVSDIYLYGEYILLRTQHNRYKIYHIHNNTLQEIKLPDDFSIPLYFKFANTNSLIEDVSKYMIFFSADKEEVIAFDSETGVFHQAKVNFFDEYKDFQLDAVRVSKTGKMFITAINYISPASAHYDMEYFAVDFNSLLSK